jgi:hypothetical protein
MNLDGYKVINMKKLLTIIFLFLAFVCSAQDPTFTPQGQGSANVLSYFRGPVGSDSALVLRYSFLDTTAANRGGLDRIPGAIIRAGGQPYMRSLDTLRWNTLGGEPIDTANKFIWNQIGARQTANSWYDTSLLTHVKIANVDSAFMEGISGSPVPHLAVYEDGRVLNVRSIDTVTAENDDWFASINVNSFF